MSTQTVVRPLVRAAAFGTLLLCFQVSLAYAIDAPKNPRGTETAQSQIKWEWDRVPDALHYEVTVDGLVAAITADTYSFSSELWVGDHSMTVKAVDAAGQASRPSLTAKIVTRASFDPAVLNRSHLVAADSPAGIHERMPDGDALKAGFVTPATDNSLIDPVTWTMPEAYSRPGYELVFSDEFNAPSLNPVRWNTQLRWDGDFNGSRYEYRQINGEEQFYVNLFSDDPEHRDTVATVYNPFELNGTRLAIRAKRNPLMRERGTATHGPLSEMVQQRPFLSGVLSTYDKFSQKYGYFEARMKIPSHVGTFPAFWLHHQKQAAEGTYRSEIDIMENLGHAPWYIYNSFHYFTGVSPGNRGQAHFLKPDPDGQVYTGTDYSLDYHVYAVEWEPGVIRWLIDDQVVSELYSEHVNYEELYLIINLAMGGLWTNFPENAGGLGRPWDQRYPNAVDLQAGNFHDPALEIDYVRVYKRP